MAENKFLVLSLLRFGLRRVQRMKYDHLVLLAVDSTIGLCNTFVGFEFYKFYLHGPPKKDSYLQRHQCIS